MTEYASLQEGATNHPLRGQAWILGRKAPADLVFAYPQISRQHARIEFRDGGYYLSDLESRFGTYCRGRPVETEPVRLGDGDEVVLGGVLALRFQDPAETRDGRRLGRLQGVWLDEESRTVWVDGQPIDPGLSSAQYLLVRLLSSAEGQFFSRLDVAQAAFPDEDASAVSEDAIDGLIKRIRARFRDVTTNEYLEVRRGRGFRLRAPA